MSPTLGVWLLKLDLITIANGLTLGLSDPVGRDCSGPCVERIHQGFAGTRWNGQGWTDFPHFICAAPAVANLELIDELELVENAGNVGAHFRTGLTDGLAGHKNVGEVRGDSVLAASGNGVFRG